MSHPALAGASRRRARNNTREGASLRSHVIAACLMLGAASAFAIPNAALAEDHLQLSAGGQIDFADYGFVGLTAALPGSAIGRGFAVRASGFGGDYSYNSGSRTIDGNFNGGEVDAVYGLSGAHYWFDAIGGVRYTDTSLSPFDPGNRRHGRQAEAAFGADGGFTSGPWRVDYYGEYGTRLDEYIARSSLTHTINNRFRGGAEVSFEGDPTYNLQRVGPYVGVRLDSRSEFQLSAGVSHQSGEGEGGYLRVLVYRSF